MTRGILIVPFIGNVRIHVVRRFVSFSTLLVSYRCCSGCAGRHNPSYHCGSCSGVLHTKILQAPIFKSGRAKHVLHYRRAVSEINVKVRSGEESECVYRASIH